MKPTYEELEQRVKESEKEANLRDQLEDRIHSLLLAIEQSSEGIAVSDLDGNLRYVNNAFADIHGYAPEKILGKNLSIFHTPEQMPSVESANRQIKEKGDFKGEIWHVRRDGHIFPTMMHNSLVRDDKGNQTGMIGTLRDISDLKQKEVELSESEEKYRKLVQDSIDGIVIMEGLEIKFVNQAVLKMFGFQREAEMVGRPMTEFISSEYRDLMVKRVDSGEMGQDLPNRYEFGAFRKDGTEFLAELSVSKIIYEGRVARQGVIRDITERKRAEEALRESEEKASIILDASIDSIILIDFECNILEINRATAEKFGKTREELIGKNITDIFPSDVANLRKLKAQEAMQSGRILRFEDQREGSWYDQICYPIFDTEGKAKILAVIARDITDRKRAEEALRESETNLKLIYDTVGDVVFQVGIEPDDCYRFLSINHAFLDTTGLTEKQVVDKRIEEVIPEPSHSLVLGKYKEAIREKRTVKWEETSIYPSRVKFGAVTITPALDEDGICTHLIGSVHDITERKRIEEALLESEERYRLLVETMNDGLGIQDENGFITYVNNKLCQMLDYKLDDFVGKTAFDFLDDNNKQIFKDKLALRRKGIAKTYEIEWTSKGGKQIQTIMSPQAIFNEEGKFTGSFAVVTDISALKKAEEVLQKTNEQLEQKVEQRTAELINANEQLRREIEERKGAEEAVQESEEKYRSLVESSGDSIYLLSRSARYLFINKKGLSRFGAPLNKIIGKHYSEFHSEESSERFTEIINDVFESGKPLWYEHKSERDGRHFAQTISPVKGPDGRATSVTVVSKDITGLKKVENSLKIKEKELEVHANKLVKANKQLRREIEARKRREDELEMRVKFEKMLNNISAEAVFVEDIAKFQKRCLKIMGKTLDVCRIYIFEHRHETDTMDNTFEWVAPGIMSQKENRQGISSSSVPWWMDMMKNNQIINYKDIEDMPSDPEKEILRTQNIKAILVVPLFFAGDYFGFMGFDECRFHREWKGGDINILSTTAQIITRTINRYRSDTDLRIKDNAIESSMNAMAFTDTQGSLTYVNKSFLKMWGYDDNKEVIGRPAFEFWQDRKKASEIVKVLRKTERWFGELVARRKDGSLFNTQLSTSIVKDSAGKQILRMGSFVDITKQKKAEKALWKRETALVEKSHHLEEANMALRIILKQLNIEKDQMEKRIVSNVKRLILPYLSRLKNSLLKSSQMSYVNNIENHLNEILSPFAEKLSSEHLNLTSSEIRVARLIKEGKSTKEISGLLHSSESVVIFHRHNIRKKLGLINKKITLKSHLQTL